jgi:hypothetical protein
VLSGTRYLRPVNSLYADILRARTANQRDAVPELAAAQAATLADLAAVASVERSLGPNLKTADQLQALTTDIDALSRADAGDAAFATVVADIQALIAQVGDGSSLILDPALDSYYLMDIVVIELPNAQDLSGQPAASSNARPSRPKTGPTCTSWPSPPGRVWTPSNAAQRSPTPIPRTPRCAPISIPRCRPRSPGPPRC